LLVRFMVAKKWMLAWVAAGLSLGSPGCAQQKAEAPQTAAAHNPKGSLPAAAAAEAQPLAAREGDNILNPDDPGNEAGYAINEQYYGTPYAVPSFSASAYYPVVPGVRYASNNNLVHSAWYDDDKEFLAPFGDGVAPEDAAYVRVSIQTGALPTTMLIYGGQVPATYKPFFGKSRSTKRPFKGKKAVLLGTSLTFQHVYVDYLQARTELDTIINKGVPGQLLRNMADHLTAADLAGAAFVSVEGPTNDYGHGYSTAGQVTDTPDMATICGDLKYVVGKIRTLDNKVPIVVLSDTWRGAYANEPVPPAANHYGLTLEAGCQALMATADYLGLPHWDAYHLAGITPGNVDATTQDHLHWNSAGGALVGNGYGDFLNQLK
jgi:hypothetical protein